MRKIKSAECIYTGGNIWVFFGDLKDGNYFMVDDYGDVTILDCPFAPGNDDVWYFEWQDAHKVEYLEGDERVTFCNELVDYLTETGICRKCGMSDTEMNEYKNYFSREL